MTLKETHSFEVLIVEDQQRYRELLVREVREMGFGAEGVATAEQAWMRISTAQVHAMILDLHLPGKNGMELLEQVKAEGLDIGVVILTAYGAMDSAIQALRYHVADYLTKPCSLSDIEAVLTRMHQVFLEQKRTDDRYAFAATEEQADSVPNEVDDVLAPLEAVERRHIMRVLHANKGNKPAAARQLGISLRTLYNRLSEYGEFSDSW